ncbi:hypothetical protein [Nonomuraea dietziae]|uniref:hypothetical protein n=1 Tax=Nonomuraea dietziae TaxID=65515 RepID=UPI003447A4E7
MYATEADIRQAAYAMAMRVTPRPWDVTEVKQRADRIAAYLRDSKPMPLADFDRRVLALRMQTTALGCHPASLRGQERIPPASATTAEPDWSDVGKLLRDARRILDYLNG